MGEIGKKRGKEQNSKYVRENVEVLKSAGKVQQQEILPTVELLAGSGARCARANILLWVHRYNTVVHQSVVEN